MIVGIFYLYKLLSKSIGKYPESLHISKMKNQGGKKYDSRGGGGWSVLRHHFIFEETSVF